MIRRELFLLFIFFTSCSQPADKDKILINEIMSSNFNFISDDDGDYSDWIEIYNPNSKSVDLSSYFLSDDSLNLKKWKFPDIQIHANQHVVVWASGKDRMSDGLSLHTNFKLNSGTEGLYLSNINEQIIDQVGPVEIPTNSSYGLCEGQIVSLNDPTPGNSNLCNTTSNTKLPPVSFSLIGGSYSEELTLELGHEDSNAIIIYTIDCSEPNFNDLTSTYNYKVDYNISGNSNKGKLLIDTLQTYIYEKPIKLKFQEKELNHGNKVVSIMDVFITNFYNITFDFTPQIYSTRNIVIRAKAIKENGEESDITTHTYFYQGESQDLPRVSLVTSPQYLFDYQNGMYTLGVDFDNWRKEYPNEQVNFFSNANYHRRGKSMEKSANLEFFDLDSGIAMLNQSVGLRINGNIARSFPAKAFRLYARNLYGKSGMKYAFFKGDDVQDFKTLLLRNGGSDQQKSYIRDVINQSICEPLNFPIQKNLPTELFLNGEYWGVFNLRERQDEHYVETHFKVPYKDVIIIDEPFSLNPQDYKKNKQSLLTDYLNLKSFMFSDKFEGDSALGVVESKIDLQNMTDYFIANIFVANMDWPNQNNRCWNLKEENSNHDGKWRWLMFDTDYSHGLTYKFDREDYPEAVQKNMLKLVETWNVIGPHLLWRNESYKKIFINRFCDIINTVFNQEATLHKIDSIASVYRPSMKKHLLRWPYPTVQTIDEWDFEIDYMKHFFSSRPNIQLEQLKEYFNLNETYELKIVNNNLEYGVVKVNSLIIRENNWSGVYFRNIPLSVSAIPNDGYSFSGWKENSSSDQMIVIDESNNDKIMLTPIFKAHE